MSLELLKTDDEVVSEFAESLRGSLLRPDDEGYDEARTVWNATIDRHPALVVQCADAADVVNAIAFAKEHEYLISVKGGGHNIAGLTLGGGGSRDVPLLGMKTEVSSMLSNGARFAIRAGNADYETGRCE